MGEAGKRGGTGEGAAAVHPVPIHSRPSAGVPTGEWEAGGAWVRGQQPQPPAPATAAPPQGSTVLLGLSQP